MVSVRQIVRRLLESYDMMRRGVPEAYLCDPETVIVFLSDEEATMLREWLVNNP